MPRVAPALHCLVMNTVTKLELCLKTFPLDLWSFTFICSSRSSLRNHSLLPECVSSFHSAQLQNSCSELIQNGANKQCNDWHLFQSHKKILKMFIWSLITSMRSTWSSRGWLCKELMKFVNLYETMRHLRFAAVAPTFLFHTPPMPQFQRITTTMQQFQSSSHKSHSSRKGRLLFQKWMIFWKISEGGWSFPI